MNKMNFNLEDIANFIGWNNTCTRDGYGLQEIEDLVCEFAEIAGYPDEMPDNVAKGLFDTARKILTVGIQAGAQLQAQLLIGGMAQ